MKLSEIARRLGRPIEGGDGAGATEIRGVGSLDDATAGQLTFLVGPKYAGKAATTKASAILLGPNAASVALPAIRVADAYASFAEVDFLVPPAGPAGGARRPPDGDRGALGPHRRWAPRSAPTWSSTTT